MVQGLLQIVLETNTNPCTFDNFISLLACFIIFSFCLLVNALKFSNFVL